MPTLTLLFAPQTRTADAAVRAPRKNLRVFGSDKVKLSFGAIVSGRVATLSGFDTYNRIDRDETRLPRVRLSPTIIELSSTDWGCPQSRYGRIHAQIGVDDLMLTRRRLIAATFATSALRAQIGY